MFQYLKPDNIVEVFKTSRQYTEGLTDRFFEYERIARNKPKANIPKELPKTTDGTTASIIRKTPHRIIQKLPTGTVTSTTDDWLSVIAEFIYYDRIIPNANEGYALIQKCWSVIERFLSFGSCPTYAPFVQYNGYFCTDLRLPYWGDMFLQPGKLSDADSNYIFMRSWWQTKDIDALIDSQSKLDKSSRTWDVEALKAVKDYETTKDDKAKTPAERELNINTKGGVEFITGFQRGVGAKFYTFHIQTTGTGDKTTQGTILRTKINKDPRGELPVSYAYGDVDGSNPLGRSVIELVGPIQNMIDGQMQMFEFAQALFLGMPTIKRGNWNKSRAKLAPNVIVDLGSDPNATWEPLKLDNTSLQRHPENYGLMKSQLYGLLSSPNTDVGAAAGNPQNSKTPQGVDASRADLSVDDNYVRKQFETWFERWSETAINLFFAEREGIEELQLDQKTADKLKDLAQKGKFDLNMLSEDNKIRINYSSATPALKFEVDASTSKEQDEIKQLQSLTSLEELLRKSDLLQSIVPPEKQIGLWNAFVDNSGVKNPEELELSQEEIQKAIQSMGDNKPSPRENVITNYKDLPEDIKRQQEVELGFKASQGISPSEQQAQAAQPQEQTPQPDPLQITPDHLLKAKDQDNKYKIDAAKLILENKKIDKMAKVSK